MKLSKQQALHGAPLIHDPRFSRLHFDPRFQRAAKRKLRVPVDARFRRMFSDHSFADPFALDKRGRPIRKRKKRHSLHQYYQDRDGVDGEAEVGEYRAKKHVPGDVEFSAKRNASQQDDGLAVSKTRSKKHNRLDAESMGMELNEIPESSDQPNEKFASKARSSKDAQYISEEDSDSSEDTDSSDDSADSSEAGLSASSSSSAYSSEEEHVDSPTEEAPEEKIPVTNEETRRLALVNMDWNHIRALDILVVMNSFLPKGGKVLSVSVYQSEFGLQQMKEEEQQGPKSVFELEGPDGADDGINVEKLRQYEKAKLRYYYAVIECDSNTTADFLYKSCDGMEFERTANTLDLRFIPEDMKFEQDPRDRATEVPSDYQAPLFETRALQHSNVKLTWDDDEPARVRTLHQKFNAEQLNEMDFRAYLASDASDVGEDKDYDGEESYGNDQSDLVGVEGRFEDLNEDERGNDKEQNKHRDKYRVLLLGSDDLMESKAPRNVDKDLEITFHSGLEELSKRLMDNKSKPHVGETVWEAYLRKRKEKRKEQKKTGHDEEDDEYESAEEEQSADPFFTHDIADFDDPFFKSGEERDLDAKLETEVNGPKRGSNKPAKLTLRSKKGERAQLKLEVDKNKVEEERNRAELDLLLADENHMEGAMKGYNLKKRRPKGKRKEVDMLSEKFPTVNYDDPRFAALFTSHRFAIDPTEPEFKRSAAQLRSLLEKQQKLHSEADHGNGPDSNVANAGKSSNKTKHELSLLVRSLKRKVGTNG